MVARSRLSPVPPAGSAGDASARRGGRPRNDVAGGTVLQAAYDILAEDGLGGLTIEAVARRAGVGRPMIYRRWQNKGTLAVACFQATVMPDVMVARTGDPAVDLQQFMRRSITAMDGPAGRIFGSIVAEAQRDPATLKALNDHYLTSRTDELAALIEDGKAGGLFKADLDTGTAVTMILGSILYWLLLTDRDRRQFASSIVEMVFRALGSARANPMPVQASHAGPKQ